MDTEIIALSASELALKIKERELSPVDIVDAYLARIRDRNERTNAFVTVTDDRARAEAQKAEEQLESGTTTGTLHGVPVAIKDLEDVAGVPTTYGSKLFEDFVADTNEVFVDRLEAAGAIVIGKTNTPEFGLGTTTTNRVSGTTNCPFDLERIAGGSSGGAAAALGDSMVPLAQGSDTGGSIRTPAACCGVYGFKPTFGRIPRVDRPNAFSEHTPFSHIGPMARTVEDAALMFSIMEGHDARDPFSLPDAEQDFIGATTRSVEGIEIGYSPTLGVFPVSDTVRETVADAVDELAGAGAIVERAEPSFGVDHEAIIEAYYSFVTVRWEALFDSLETQGFDPRGEDKDQLGSELVDVILGADPVSTREYKQAEVIRTKVLDGIHELLSAYDVIITPTTSIVPFKHGEYPTEINGREIDPRRGWLLTQPCNFTGHPTASIPAGFPSGLPVGMQIIGERYSDDMVLRVSAAYERARPWQQNYPV